jgi:hypothetical protein
VIDLDHRGELFVRQVLVRGQKPEAAVLVADAVEKFGQQPSSAGVTGRTEITLPERVGIC